jgi:pSer/pThr/pTyr-binding forkhead associated (FHA) protein
MIEDLRSTNRTFVNGEPVGERPRRLADGDIVRFGAPDAAMFEHRARKLPRAEGGQRRPGRSAACG